MSYFEIGGSDIAECTSELRWVPKSMLQAADLKLQQLWRIRAVDKEGYATGSRIEWRDVPITPKEK